MRTHAKGLKITDSEYRLTLHKLVKYAPSKHTPNTKPMQEKEKMKPQTLAPQQRKKLEQKIMTAFKTEMKNLQKPFQRIIADDLVTAFENRISVIHAFQQKISQKRG